MATVERLLPRHWDGRRLLQFLTGLALIALAFAVPGHLSPGEPTEAPVPIVTTVDSPATGGLPVTNVPAQTRSGGKLTDLALDSAPAPSAKIAGSDQGATEATGTEAAGTDAAAQGATPASGGAPASVHHGDRPVCVEARAAVDGSTQRSHGKRGPPRT